MSAQIISELKALPGIDEALHVTTLKCHRHSGEHDQMIDVTLYDAGEETDEPALRFTASATADNGKATSGNAGATSQEALVNLGLHFGELD